MKFLTILSGIRDSRTYAVVVPEEGGVRRLVSTRLMSDPTTAAPQVTAGSIIEGCLAVNPAHKDKEGREFGESWTLYIKGK